MLNAAPDSAADKLLVDCPGPNETVDEIADIVKETVGCVSKLDAVLPSLLTVVTPRSAVVCKTADSVVTMAPIVPVVKPTKVTRPISDELGVPISAKVDEAAPGEVSRISPSIVCSAATVVVVLAMDTIVVVRRVVLLDLVRAVVVVFAVNPTNPVTTDPILTIPASTKMEVSPVA